MSVCIQELSGNTTVWDGGQLYKFLKGQEMLSVRGITLVCESRSTPNETFSVIPNQY